MRLLLRSLLLLALFLHGHDRDPLGYVFWWQAGGQLNVAIVCPWACLPYRCEDGMPGPNAQCGNRNNPYISVT
jgi:hypothetical protein